MKDARLYIYDFYSFLIDNHDNILKFKINNKVYKRKYRILKNKYFKYCYVFRYKNEMFYINKEQVYRNYK